MVICGKTGNFVSTAFLLVFNHLFIPGRCQNMYTTDIPPLDMIQPEIGENYEIKDKQFYEETVPQTIDEFGNLQETYSVQPDSSGNFPQQESDYSVQECYEDTVEVSEKKYGKLLLLGSVALLILGLCCCLCFASKKDSCENIISESSSWSCCGDHQLYRVEGTAYGDCRHCVVNVSNTSPDLSEPESEQHRYKCMPLPLIYDDAGKICNNAEIFIQRCMTSSVKRTYSEPVKAAMTSRTRFKDYIKELAYLREKQRQQECQKHGAVKTFFEGLFEIIGAIISRKRKKRRSTKEKFKDGRARKDMKSWDFKKRKENTKERLNKSERELSNSVSITSLLLKPKYQHKYYNRSSHSLKSEKEREKRINRNKEKFKQYCEDIKNIGATAINTNEHMRSQKTLGIKNKKNQIGNQKMQMNSQSTEELISACVETLREPFRERFKHFFEGLSAEKFARIQEVMGILTQKLLISDVQMVNERSSTLNDSSLLNDRSSCQPNLVNKDQIPPLDVESNGNDFRQDKSEPDILFETYVEKLLLKSNPPKILYSTRHMKHTYLVPSHDSTIDEEKILKIKGKYADIQREVEQLNGGMAKFVKNVSNSPALPRTSKDKR